MIINARNTNYLAPMVYRLLQERGITQDSRNGTVLSFPEPVQITLTHPWERVNFDPVRDANPFFHLIEGVAMLGDFNNVKLLSHFSSGMSEFSDDGERYNAFYGERLRSTWGDQLDKIIRNLTANPDSRQEVALMWNPDDLDKVTKDKACNLALLFRVVGNWTDPNTQESYRTLDMTSINRSNDGILGGVSGANIVHLSMFHEYVALGSGFLMGKWHHYSNNLHVYTDGPFAKKWDRLKDRDFVADFYEHTHIPPYTLFGGPKDRAKWDQGIRLFLGRALLAITPEEGQSQQLLHAGRGDYGHPFINDLCVPVFNAWQFYKAGEFADAQEVINSIRFHDDWRYACSLWLERRVAKIQRTTSEAAK